jgi:hypothetical protein
MLVEKCVVTYGKTVAAIITWTSICGSILDPKNLFTGLAFTYLTGYNVLSSVTLSHHLLLLSVLQMDCSHGNEAMEDITGEV